MIWSMFSIHKTSVPSSVAMRLIVISLCFIAFSGRGEGEKPYVRTEIEDIAPKPHENIDIMGIKWDNMRKAHVEAVAAMVNIYPNQDIYFLARDAEYMYDMAKLLVPDQASRFHLINVSRLHIEPLSGCETNLKEYLVQNGITEAKLAKGEVVLFDTGFKGTIPEAIQRLFPDHGDKISTHLMVSRNPDMPPLRSSLQHLNKIANWTKSLGQGGVIAYEHMPREYSRSYRYENIDGTWTPIAGSGSELSDVIDPKAAQEVREDLHHYADNEGMKYFGERNKVWKELVALFQPGTSIEDQQKYGLKEKLRADPTMQGIIRDLLDPVTVKRLNIDVSPEKLQKLDVDLPPLVSLLDNFEELKNIAADRQDDPEWKTWLDVLTEPKNKIPELIKARRWATLGSIFDILRHGDTETVLANSLADAEDKAGLNEFLKSAASSENDGLVQSLLDHFFDKPQAKDHGNVLLRITKYALAESQLSLQTKLFEALARDHAVGPQFDEARNQLVEKAEKFALPGAKSYFIGVATHMARAGNCNPLSSVVLAGQIR